VESADVRHFRGKPEVPSGFAEHLHFIGQHLPSKYGLKSGPNPDWVRQA
jgi:hypothetical protein